MRYRGGGVGHSSTREATNKFLHDRDRLDIPGHDGAEEDVELKDEISGLDEGEHRYQGGSRDENSERRPQDAGEDDVDDMLGHILGGEEADGTAEDENGFGGDEEDDYGYKNHVDDDDDSESEQEPDLADDALGPEDGEGEGDEMYLLGFAAL